MLAWLKSIASRLRAQATTQTVDRDFQRELDAHLEMATQENIRRGMTPDDAARAARIRLGGNTQLIKRNLPTLANHEFLFVHRQTGEMAIVKAPAR